MPARHRRTSVRTLRLLLALLGLVVSALLAALIVPATWVFWQTDGVRYGRVEAVPNADAALVFGAGLGPDGMPTPILADRIHAAVLLFRAGKVQRLLLSGDGSAPGHDEPDAMARQAEAEGVPAEAIVRDPRGLHTQASCNRARSTFNVRTVVAVSQSYHLPRAIFLCRRSGLRTWGFSFARVAYGSSLTLRARELLSLDLAWWESIF